MAWPVCDMTGAEPAAAANALSGEVTVTVAGQDVVFKASLRALAGFQGAVGVVGLGAVEVMLEECDPRAILAGLRHLTISGNGETVIGAVSVADYQPLALGILTAIKHGLPEPAAAQAGEGGSAKTGKPRKPRRSTGS